MSTGRYQEGVRARRRHTLRPRLRSRLVPSAVVTLAAFAIGGIAGTALGNVDAAGPAAEAGNFGSTFFISHSVDADGQRSIEWLGSAVIWFLLLLSMLSIGLIGFMAMTNQRKAIVPAGMVSEVRALLHSGKYREAIELTGRDSSDFSRLVHASLQQANLGFSAVIRTLEQAGDELTTARLRRIEYLNVLGQISPMIGLFGTVYGMILAFHSLVAAGGQANPAMLAGGIGTALTTTFWGLVVAIPALAGYAVIRNKIDELTTEASLEAEALLNRFRPVEQPAARPAAGRRGSPGNTGSEPGPAT